VGDSGGVIYGGDDEGGVVIDGGEIMGGGVGGIDGGDTGGVDGGDVDGEEVKYGVDLEGGDVDMSD